MTSHIDLDTALMWLLQIRVPVINLEGKLKTVYYTTVTGATMHALAVYKCSSTLKSTKENYATQDSSDMCYLMLASVPFISKAVWPKIGWLNRFCKIEYKGCFFLKFSQFSA